MAHGPLDIAKVQPVGLHNRASRINPTALFLNATSIHCSPRAIRTHRTATGFSCMEHIHDQAATEASQARSAVGGVRPFVLATHRAQKWTVSGFQVVPPSQTMDRPGVSIFCSDRLELWARSVKDPPRIRLEPAILVAYRHNAGCDPVPGTDNPAPWISACMESSHSVVSPRPGPPRNRASSPQGGACRLISCGRLVFCRGPEAEDRVQRLVVAASGSWRM